MTFKWTYLIVAFFLFEWALRVVMLVVVPRNRRPSSATAWLMLIMLEPIVGSLVYAAFGTPRMPKYRKQLQQYADTHIASELTNLGHHATSHTVNARELTATEEQFAKLNEALGGFAVTGGNKVEFLDDYEQSITSLVRDIQKAKKRVLFEYFILVLDKTTEPVVLALEEAVSRGVEVYVLFDALACRHYPNFKKLKKRLTAAGIAWRPMLPFSLRPGKEFTRPDLRNHRKIVVIDGVIGYTGSQNIVQKNYHRKDELYYEELVMRVQGPVVWQMAAVFRTDWYAETRAFLASDAIPAPKGLVKAQILPSGPSHQSSNNLKLYTSLIHSAKQKIVIVTPYFVPDDSLLTALVSAAERGVEVTLINSESIDKVLVGHAQRSYYDELLRAGVAIYLYKKPIFLHTKHITVDSNIAVVGSSNLDIRSFELDLEVSTVLYDSSVVKHLRTIEKRYAERSKRVSLLTWRKRSLRLQALDSVARLTASLQ